MTEHKDAVRKNRSAASPFWKYVSLLLLFLLIFSVFRDELSFSSSVSDDVAVQRAVAFINENILAGVATAELLSVQEEEYYYVLELHIASNEEDLEQEFVSYLSKDGNFFFPTSSAARSISGN